MQSSSIQLYRGTLAGALLLCLCSVAGCANAGGVNEHKVVSAKPDAQGFVPTVAKKPGSGVAVAYRIDGVPAAQRPISLTLRFSDVGADGGTATMVAEEGLVLSGSADVKLEPQRPTEAIMSATAPADGVYFVNVTTVQQGRSSVTSVPITVGKGKPKLGKIGTVTQDSKGQAVISLPSK